MTYIDPTLNKPLPEAFENYDTNCDDYSWRRFVENMDHYFLCHITNWFMAALVLRNAWLLNIWSVLDEVLELSFGHYMPHFRECWWDQLIADLLITNTPAIFLGLFVIRMGGWEEYDWLGKFSVTKVSQWKLWHCHRHWTGFVGILTFVSINFLAGFFFMNGLWLPPTHKLVVLRLVVWFFMAFLGFKEMWNDVKTWDTAERVENPVFAQ
jgi:phosphatidylserine synthase 2